MELEILNPWWKAKGNIELDKHISELNGKKYQWMPAILKEIEFKVDNIFTLLGPRQVGKTTLLKLFIKELLASVDSKSIFFWSCDELVDFRELSSILREYLRFAAVYNIKDKFIFLDEISRVKDWQRAIKFLVDSGELKNCFLMMTGSHALDLKYNAERLPGRTGRYGREIFLLPMCFSDFLLLVEPELSKKISRIEAFSLQEIAKKARDASLFSIELRVLFEKYLITGGFPLVVNEFLVNNNIPEYVYDIYFNWVVGDIVRWGKQEKILLQLMKAILQKQSSAVSWDSIAKNAEIKSHKTVSSYIEALENMFVLNVLYFLELEKKMPDSSKNKKIYFANPFINAVFNKKIYFTEHKISPELTEAVAVSHLKRFGRAYYWKNKKEVDIVLQIKEELYALEIKYQNKISKHDYSGLCHFSKGILITKEFLDLEGKYLAIPLHLLLAIL